MSILDDLLADGVKFGEQLLEEELPKVEALLQIVQNALAQKKGLEPSLADAETMAADLAADAAEDAKFGPKT